MGWELEGNTSKASIVEKSRPAVVAAAREFDSYAADHLREIASDVGTIEMGEYSDALVMSMLCAEVRRLRARVERLENTV